MVGMLPIWDSDPRSPELGGQAAQFPRRGPNGSGGGQGLPYSHPKGGWFAASVYFTWKHSAIQRSWIQGVHRTWRTVFMGCHLEAMACVPGAKDPPVPPSAAVPGWCDRRPDQSISWTYAHSCPSTVVKRLLRSAAVPCRTLCWWARQPVSPGTVVLTETLPKGKVHPDPEYVLIPVRRRCLPFHCRRGSASSFGHQVAGGVLEGWCLWLGGWTLSSRSS